jgi:hypothetical protein
VYLGPSISELSLSLGPSVSLGLRVFKKGLFPYFDKNSQSIFNISQRDVCLTLCVLLQVKLDNLPYGNEAPRGVLSPAKTPNSLSSSFQISSAY